MMTVSVLLSGRLKLDGYGDGHPVNEDTTFRLALDEGSTVKDVIAGMGVPKAAVAMTMRNGRKCQHESDVRAGDRIILIPPDVAALWRALGAMNLGAESVFDF